MPEWLPLSLLVVATAGGEPPSAVSGDDVVRAPFGKSEIVVTTTSRLAGAIHSVKWSGKEFIDSADHGRQLQSACSFDCGERDEFWAERFNPTEAGSRRDGAGRTSTSRLLRFVARGNELETTSRMAFWLAPDEKSEGRPALNSTLLSAHTLTKSVRIGYRKLANVLDYRVTFTVPKGERHTFAQFEALTGYMPAEFQRFWVFNPALDTLEPLDDGPGEQAFPVVFSTTDGGHAMGVFSPDQPSRGFEKHGYGRFRFPSDKVVKWNCAFRIRGEKEFRPGEYKFRMFVPIGSLEDVRRTLIELNREFPTKPHSPRNGSR